MKIIILAANQQKSAIADKLIQNEHFSKINLNDSSNKLVSSAHAVIVYFESNADLKAMSDLIKIYSGCPLQFYFGDKRHKNFKHYYPFTQVQ
jgi:hypothetical protein